LSIVGRSGGIAAGAYRRRGYARPVSDPPATIVVPCFDEGDRLDVPRFAELAATGRVRLLFVNDGSTDGTAGLLARLRDGSENVGVIELARNGGKAEAVRRGLLEAIDGGATVVGYYDADLATPPHELLRLVELLEARPGLEVVLAARVALLGRTIERRAVRHYTGRVFATFVSLILRLRVYDTQCGAKVLRVTPALVEALSRPFGSRWVFDVELLARLQHPRTAAATPTGAIVEVPLREWRDIPGSKLAPRQMAKVPLDLLRIAAELRRSRADRR
jgi:glycosyltransferase involved in cell wall biosynthesis